MLTTLHGLNSEQKKRLALETQDLINIGASANAIVSRIEAAVMLNAKSQLAFAKESQAAYDSPINALTSSLPPLSRFEVADINHCINAQYDEIKALYKKSPSLHAEGYMDGLNWTLNLMEKKSFLLTLAIKTDIETGVHNVLLDPTPLEDAAHQAAFTELGAQRTFNDIARRHPFLAHRLNGVETNASQDECLTATYSLWKAALSHGARMMRQAIRAQAEPVAWLLKDIEGNADGVELMAQGESVGLASSSQQPLYTLPLLDNKQD